MVALVIFWVAVCFGPPPFREFFAGLFKSIMNT